MERRHRTHVQVTGSAHAPGGFVFWCTCGAGRPNRGPRREYQFWDEAERAGLQHAAEANGDEG